MNEVKKYRKKPVVIEAYQTDVEMIIPTLEGDMHADQGDYIITGLRGEQYPCKPDVFERTYEEVPGSTPLSPTISSLFFDKKPHKKGRSGEREGGENMTVKVELQGLEEMNALLKENRRLTDELMDNLRGLQRACMLINVREKENQPEAVTNG